MKRCTKCTQKKDYIEFYKDKKTQDGHSYQCKLCIRIRTQDHYYKDLELSRKKQREKSRKYYYTKKHASKCKWKPCTCDGYHTFDELYEHRHRLFIALVQTLNYPGIFKVPDRFKAWRAFRNSNGDAFEGHFLLGIGKEKGEQISYHLPLSYWEEVDFAETAEYGPVWDGHTSDDVLDRLKILMKTR